MLIRRTFCFHPRIWTWEVEELRWRKRDEAQVLEIIANRKRVPFQQERSTSTMDVQQVVMDLRTTRHLDLTGYYTLRGLKESFHKIGITFTVVGDQPLYAQAASIEDALAQAQSSPSAGS